jgi:hypothetical protein
VSFYCGIERGRTHPAEEERRFQRLGELANWTERLVARVDRNRKNPETRPGKVRVRRVLLRAGGEAERLEVTAARRREELRATLAGDADGEMLETREVFSDGERFVFESARADDLKDENLEVLQRPKRVSEGLREVSCCFVVVVIIIRHPPADLHARQVREKAQHRTFVIEGEFRWCRLCDDEALQERVEVGMSNEDLKVLFIWTPRRKPRRPDKGGETLVEKEEREAKRGLGEGEGEDASEDFVGKAVKVRSADFCYDERVSRISRGRRDILDALSSSSFVSSSRLSSPSPPLF